MKYGLGLAIQRSPWQHHQQPKKFFKNYEFGGKVQIKLWLKFIK
jgi:hypothetical protein